jgi:hypothetical protein
MTMVIAIGALVLFAFSAALAVGLGRAAARGDENMLDELALLRARSGKGASTHARPHGS